MRIIAEACNQLRVILEILARSNDIPAEIVCYSGHCSSAGRARAITVYSKYAYLLWKSVHIESAGGESAGGNRRLRIGRAAALARAALASGRYFRNHRISAVSRLHLRRQFRKRHREVIDISGRQCLQTRDLIDRLMLVRSDGDGNFVTLYDAGNQGNISRVLFP